MKEVDTIPGKSYSVHSSAGCTVSDDSGWSKTLEAQEDYFTAHGGKVYIDDDTATVRELFNSAPYQKLRLLGVVGGDKLPAGYTRLACLENTGTQYLVLPVEHGQTSGLSLSYKVKPYSGYNYLSIIRYSNKSVQFCRIAGDMQTGIATSTPTITAFVKNEGKIFVSYNEYESKKIKASTQDEEVETDIPHMPAVGETVTPVYLFAYDSSTNLGVFSPSSALYSLYEARFTLGQKLANRYVPALDGERTPCLYDIVTRTPVYNSGTGAFIAGVATQNQLEGLLRGMPDRTGQEVGTLTVRLAEALQTPENEAKLDAMLAKNWEISQAA